MDEFNKYPLGDYVKIKNGYAFKSSHFVKDGIPIIRMKDLQNGAINIDKCVKYPFDSTNKYKNYELFNEDILIGMSGSIGKIGLIKDLEGKAFLNQRVGKFEIIDKKKILQEFLYYILISVPYQKRLNLIATGVTQKNISSKQLESIKVYIPDIKTQNKIVEIIEKAEKLKEWRVEADELADEYLKSVFLEMFGSPVKNEKGWKKTKLSELGTWKSGGTPSRQRKEFFTGNMPWYTSGELNNMYISDSVENITEEAINNSNAKLIKPDSLLLGMYDTAALKSSISTINSSCNQAIAYSELEKNNSNIIYVYFAIQIGRKFFMSRQRGIRQKNLNLTMIKDTEIPLPPLELQNQFADIVHQFEEIKTHQSRSKQEIDNLFNTLMQKAFKGELVC